MGYYSDFNIWCSETDNDKIIQIKIDLEKISEYEFYLCDNNEHFSQNFQLYASGIKWYDFEEDMLELSKSHNSIGFIVYVIGEDHEEYISRYLDGKRFPIKIIKTLKF